VYGGYHQQSGDSHGSLYTSIFYGNAGLLRIHISSQVSTINADTENLKNYNHFAAGQVSPTPREIQADSGPDLISDWVYLDWRIEVNQGENSSQSDQHFDRELNQPDKSLKKSQPQREEVDP